jgi:hypothetical protein
MHFFKLCRVPPLARAVSGQTAKTQGPTAISDSRGARNQSHAGAAMSRRNEALGRVAPSNLAKRYHVLYRLFFRAFIETNASRPEGVGWSRGGTISLKASDAAVINDSKDDQNRTSPRSC